MHRIFNSLLGVSPGDETLRPMLDTITSNKTIHKIIFLVFTICEFDSKKTHKQQKRYFGAINVLNTGNT